MLSEYLNLDNISLPYVEKLKNFPKASDRASWENIDADKKKMYIEKAEKNKGFRWPALLAMDYMKFTTEGTRWPYTTPQDERRYMLSCFAIAECIEHKGRFMEDIINGIYAICEETTWVSNAHNFVDEENNNAQAHNEVYPLPMKKSIFIDLWAGTTANTLAWVYYLLKDELDAVSPIICENIEYMMEERIFIPYETKPKMWWRRAANNWNININSQILQMATIFIKDEKRRKKIYEDVLEGLNIFMNAYHDDGACEEGPHYCTSNLRIMVCFEFLSHISNGQIDCLKFDKLKRMANFEVNMYAGNNTMITFSDCKLHRHHGGKFVFGLGKRFDSENLKCLGVQFGEYASSGDEIIEASLENLFPPKNLHEEMAEYKNKEIKFDKRVYYDSTNTLFLREKDFVGGFVLAVKGGCNDEHHNHNDVGNFALYNDTEPVIIDMGIGDYTKQAFSPDRYSVWVMNSKYHNVPYIGGIEQKAGPEFKADKVVCEGDRISMDIAPAYGSDKIKKYVRSLEYDRAANEFKFCDEYEYFQDMETDIHFMLCEVPTLEDGRVLLNAGVVIEYGDGIEAEYEQLSGEIEEYPVVEWTDECQKTIGRLKLKTSGKSGKAEFVIKKA